MTYPITGHMIVVNEDQFIWFAISSVLPFLEKLIIYDTGSVDETVEIIKSFKNSKIVFEEKGKVTPDQLVSLRREQIEKTKTQFFLLVDGDEIWPEKNLNLICQTAVNMPKDKLAIFCRTRNCVGDIYHYLPESAGRYKIAGHKGHLNIRLFRKTPDVSVIGTYPLEAYTYAGQPINRLTDQLFFVDTWYLHATHLKRSSVVPNKKFKYELGLSMGDDELPEVLRNNQPTKRNLSFLARAIIETPLKKIKRKIL